MQNESTNSLKLWTLNRFRNCSCGFLTKCMAQWKENECKNKNNKRPKTAWARKNFGVYTLSLSFTDILLVIIIRIEFIQVYTYKSAHVYEFSLGVKGVGTFILKSLSPNESTMESRTQILTGLYDLSCGSTPYAIKYISIGIKNLHNSFNLINCFNRANFNENDFIAGSKNPKKYPPYT